MVVLVQLVAVWGVQHHFQEQSDAVSVDAFELADPVLGAFV